MKIDDLIISNFRGIARAEIRSAGDTIIIAGQNGSGKSCIFDAIRLMKSVYGGYHQNEWQSWFGEFQINPNSRAQELRGMFNDPTKPVTIDCYFRLRDEEKAFINSSAAELLEEAIWRVLLPEAYQWGGFRMAMFASQFREREPEVKAQVRRELPGLREELQGDHVLGHVEVQPGGRLQIRMSRLLSVIFTNYRPKDLGVIDYHGAQRHYGREAVQGINLNLDQNEQAYSQSALYNYSNKYNNVKSEMAAGFVKEILAERAGKADALKSGLTGTLKELFATFFPEKEFLGPQPTQEGSLEFPVRTQNGNIHDLDELSAGEKEILYGYLRIRSSAPRNSIILLDEPELHLNPRLIRNLPEFYRRHLGEELQNQIWLVTHSDALLREAVGRPGFNVFHMLPCGAEDEQGQLHPLKITEDLDYAMTDLVGDLAAYRPGGTAIIFEGGGDSDFDQSVAARLFPELLSGINLLSGSNKARVTALHEVLDAAYSKGDLPIQFFAIVDGDSEQRGATIKGVRTHSWDVYHLENYLLEPQYIAEAINTLEPRRGVDQEAVLDGLRTAARKVVPKMLRHLMRSHANHEVVSCFNLNFDPAAEDISGQISAAVNRSLERVQEAAKTTLKKDSLADHEAKLAAEIEESFANGSWKEKLPGRDILRAFRADAKLDISYEGFRNLIVGQMVADGFEPQGMKRILEEIVDEAHGRTRGRSAIPLRDAEVVHEPVAADDGSVAGE